jgi:UDP-N-acetylmuramoylalanine--D-glutamate ligase
VASFRPVEHRLEPVATVDGVEFVNDSKATNVDSALRAIESFETRIVLIAGGLDKGASFERLAAALAPRVRQVVTIGRAARLIEDAIAGRVPVERARNMGEAVAIASAASRPGDVVLLAPACASFDMFANYEERGREFRKAVRALLERSGAPGPQGTRDGRVPRYE